LWQSGLANSNCATRSGGTSCVGSTSGRTPITCAEGDPGTVRPQSQHAKFYDPYSKRVPLDLSQNEVIGWFEM
jgi:hypothetical protein